MNRNEKIAGFALGAVLFAGLFYFIYSSWKAAPAGPDADTTLEEMNFEDDNAGFEEDEGTGVTESTAPVTGAETPAK